MEDALKRMAVKENTQELSQRSTFGSRLAARVRFNSLTKRVAIMKAPVSGPSVIEIG